MKTKAKKRARLRAAVGDMVLAELAIARTSPEYSVITIRFENTALDIPFLPWNPRTEVTLPGRWVKDED